VAEDLGRKTELRRTSAWERSRRAVPATPPSETCTYRHQPGRELG
jgi:hypothetical protein